MSAALLVALTLSPFTAPFPTCDLATLLGATRCQPARADPKRSLTASPNDAALVRVTPLARSAGRVRLVALTGRGTSSAVREFPTAAVDVIVRSPISAALRLRAVLRI